MVATALMLENNTNPNPSFLRSCLKNKTKRAIKIDPIPKSCKPPNLYPKTMSIKSKNGIVITFTKLKVVRSALTTPIKEECVCNISKIALTVKVGSDAKEKTNESRKNIKTTKNNSAQT